MVRSARSGPRMLLVVVAALLLGGTPQPAAANEAAVGTSVEAWYRGSLVAGDTPFCILPCPAVAAPERPHPEDTLHVGVSAGREAARTYLELDLTSLPPERVLTGGEVRLPVAGADAGSTAPELAELVACRVIGIVEPVEGGEPGDAPPVDCSTSSPVVLDDAGEVFVFDLAPLVDDRPSFGDLPLAILASEEAQEEGATWRVAFHGRERDTDDAEPITAVVIYVTDETAAQAGPGPSGSRAPDSPSEPSGTSAPAAPFAPSPSSGAPPPAFSQDTAAEGGLPQLDTPADQPTVAEAETATDEATPAGMRRVRVVTTRYAYPQVWLLPLAFLAVGGLLTRALSQPYHVDPGHRPPPSS